MAEIIDHVPSQYFWVQSLISCWIWSLKECPCAYGLVCNVSALSHLRSPYTRQMLSATMQPSAPAKRQGRCSVWMKSKENWDVQQGNKGTCTYKDGEKQLYQLCDRENDESAWRLRVKEEIRTVKHGCHEPTQHIPTDTVPCHAHDSS